MSILLGKTEVSDLLSLPQAMRVLEQTFREQAQGKVKQVAPLRFMNRGMRMVVGGLEAQDKNGLRVSVTGGDALALLFEISTGKFLSLMAYPFSELRISATVGLAIERFTAANIKTAALIGSGRLASALLQGALAVRSLKQILVYSRNSENREKFARRAREQFKISAMAVTSPEAAIEQADFVLVSTNSPAAALHGEWLRPGLAVFGIGRPNEFDDQVYLRANLNCVTSKIHELNYYDTQLNQPLIRLSKAGAITWNSVAEFCDIVAGKVVVPDLRRSLVVFRDSQGGYGDLALAAWVYEEAKRRGLGQQFSAEQ